MGAFCPGKSGKWAMTDWFDVYLEEEKLCRHPVLRVSFLRRVGLLGEEPGSVSWQVELAKSTITIEAVWLPELSVLRIKTKPGKAADYDIAVEVKLTNGRRDASFKAPASGRRCRILYYYNNRFDAREAFGFEPPSRRLTPAMRREIAIQASESVGAWKKPYDPVTYVRSGGSRPKNDSIAPHSTAWALRDGDPNPADPLPQRYIEFGFATERPPVDPCAHLAMGIWEEQPRLEIGKLAQAGLLQPGEIRHAVLNYGHTRSGNETGLIWVNLSDPANPYLGIASWSVGPGGERVSHAWRTLRITGPEGANNRWYMICPFTGARTLVVAYREGWWGTKKPLRLENQSQRSKRFVHKVQRQVVETPRLRVPV